jgi:hypothetical protein
VEINIGISKRFDSQRLAYLPSFVLTQLYLSLATVSSLAASKSIFGARLEVHTGLALDFQYCLLLWKEVEGYEDWVRVVVL